HRPAPINESVLDRAAESVYRPELFVVRNDVGVVEQDDRAFASVAAQPRPDHAAARKWLEDLILDAFAFADVGEELSRANLIARRIGRVDFQILDEEF